MEMIVMTRDISRRVAGRLFLLLVLLTTSLFGTGCEGRGGKPYEVLHEYDRSVEYFPGKQWSKTASPEMAGWSVEKLELARKYSNTLHSGAVVVVENGVIVAEWGNITTRYKLDSVRKSLMSAMYGIFVDKKIINPTSTLKELHITDTGGLSPNEERATVHNLLTARSGVFHPAAYETEGMQEKRPQRNSHDPGTFWFYNNWDFNVLLTIFNQETKEDFFEQFQERIAKPLQMEQFGLEDTSYHYDLELSSHPAYLFRMSALDLARFGLLYLREGKWRGQQILSGDWIRRSTQKYTVLNPKKPERGYGYLWWIDEGVFYASGNGGQRLFIIPELDVVIVHRVDTDSKIRVKTTSIWELFDKILQAREK